MATMNWTLVLLGGLVAGTVMNAGEAALHGGVLAADAEAVVARHQLAPPGSAVPLVSLILMTYLLGTAAVWLYAAIRPRYGAGPSTAVIAGLAVWTLAHLWSGIYLGMGFFDLIPAKLAYLPIAWGLVEAPLATLAGAWFYKEG